MNDGEDMGKIESSKQTVIDWSPSLLRMVARGLDRKAFSVNSICFTMTDDEIDEFLSDVEQLCDVVKNAKGGVPSVPLPAEQDIVSWH